MSVIEHFDLGSFITVVKDKPLKFHAFAYHLDADTADPINQIPYYLKFSQLPPLDEKAIEFVVRISSDLRDFYFLKRQKDMFFSAVKYGFMNYRTNCSASEFDFFVNKYEEMMASTISRGQKVRDEVLIFINTVNSIYPSWKINRFDLEVNINAERDQIEQWADDLVRTELLLSEMLDIENKIFGGHIGLSHYYINPKMRREIYQDIELAKTKNQHKKMGIDKLEIFISYSHKDKELAGQISDRLKETGFDTFLAHEYIEVDKDWRIEILKHLGSCDIFVALVSSYFNDSEWTHQETGYALATNKKIISLKLGGKLEGFLEARQALQVEGDEPEAILEKIRDCINRLIQQNEST